MGTVGARYSTNGNTMMKLNFVAQWVLVGKPIQKPISGTRLFSSSVKQWEGGVSMVQGASRGIGLEFVSPLFSAQLSYDLASVD